MHVCVGGECVKKKCARVGVHGWMGLLASLESVRVRLVVRNNQRSGSPSSASERATKTLGLFKVL